MVEGFGIFGSSQFCISSSRCSSHQARMSFSWRNGSAPRMTQPAWMSIKALLPAYYRMKVGRVVVAVKHGDSDSVKQADFRHTISVLLKFRYTLIIKCPV